eukprot:gene8268-biopygen9148
MPAPRPRHPKPKMPTARATPAPVSCDPGPVQVEDAEAQPLLGADQREPRHGALVFERWGRSVGLAGLIFARRGRSCEKPVRRRYR